MPEQHPQDEGQPASPWACILVSCAGDWLSSAGGQDRGLVLAFFPAAQSLHHVVQQHAALLRPPYATAPVLERPEQCEPLGRLVQSLVAAPPMAALAVGRIPATRWPVVKRMGHNQWATLVARLVVGYLLFVHGRVWVAAVGPEEVDDVQWEFYQAELRKQLKDICDALKRADRTVVNDGLRLGVYAEGARTLTYYDGHMSGRPHYHWYPDGDQAQAVPIEDIRGGIRLLACVGHIMLSGLADGAQPWRERLQGSVRELADLTQLRW